MTFRNATSADFENLASKWLLDLYSEPFLRLLTSESLQEQMLLKLYNGVASFLEDPQVPTIVEELDERIVAFAVCDTKASLSNVCIATFWSLPSHDASVLAKMVMLDRPIEEVIVYKLFCPRALRGAQYSFLPLLERAFSDTTLNDFTKTSRPRVLQAVHNEDNHADIVLLERCRGAYTQGEPDNTQPEPQPA